jgi:ATP-dependent DNA ligase
LVALGPDGRPDFHLLQNFRSAKSRIVYYAFDILVHEGQRLTELPLLERRAILMSVVEPGEHVALSQVSDRPVAEMLRFVKSHGLEGAVAKRSDSVYQLGQRSGLWSKYRVDLSIKGRGGCDRSASRCVDGFHATQDPVTTSTVYHIDATQQFSNSVD